MRSILCPDCSSRFHMHPEDAADGWHMRKVEIRAKVPTDGSHRIIIQAGTEEEQVIPVQVIVCDHCNDEIAEGTTGICVSMWRGQDEPDNWEQNYDSTQQTSPSPDQETGTEVSPSSSHWHHAVARMRR